MNINDAISSFLLYISSERRLSVNTVTRYEIGLRQFGGFLSDKFQIADVEDISHLEVREWQISLSDNGAAAATIKCNLVIVRSFFKYLRRQGIITSDIMAKVVSPKMPKHLPVFFTEKETEKIYDS